MQKLIRWLCIVLAMVLLVPDMQAYTAHAEETADRQDLDHYDTEAVFTFIDTLPTSLEEWNALPQEWWDALLSVEYMYAERSYVSYQRGYDPDRPIVPDESLEGYIRRLQSGESEEAVFGGTIFEGTTVEMLLEAQAEGCTMDEIFRMRMEMDTYAGDHAVLSTAWVDILGTGRVNRKYLDGEIAFCWDQHKGFPNGATYSKTSAEDAGLTDRAAFIVEYYFNAPVDHGANHQFWSACQLAVWAVQEGITTADGAAAFVNTYCRQQNITSQLAIADYLEVVPQLVVGSIGRTGTCYVYAPDDPANQSLAVRSPIWEPDPGVSPRFDTVSASVNRTASVTHTVHIDAKYASLTGEKLPGVTFQVHENGVLKGTITTDENGVGSLSWQVSETRSGSSDTMQYCTNFDELNVEQRKEIACYRYRSDAVAAAEAQAAERAQAAAHEAAHAGRTVTVKETGTPAGFQVLQTEYTFVLAGNDSEPLSVRNDNWKAKLIIDKVDGVSGERMDAVAVFALLEWDGTDYVVSPNYELIRLDDGTYTVDGKYERAETGYLYYTRQNQGRFGIREISAPYGYLLDEDTCCFEITANGQVIYGHNEEPGSYEINDNTKFANMPKHIYVSIPKVDKYSGLGIEAEAVFTVTPKSGNLTRPVTFTKQADGSYLSSEIYYNESNQGLFLLTETAAPTGYYGDFAGDEKRTYEIDMTDLAAGAVVTVTNDSAGEAFENERVYGEITIRKYDCEAEVSGITQGDVLTLNGSIYGLYAAEDIYHADGSGLLYEKDQLVAEAAIGQSVVTDEDGYLLDSEGNRCILSGQEPALTETSGQSRFAQVELGSYYVSEISPAAGYLPDTTVHRGEELKKYYVTFCYEDDTKRVVARRENADRDDNLLTLDDVLDTTDIHSGDWVFKQAAQFIKVNDDDLTEKEPIAGAGFTLYRISQLARVKDGTITMDGTAWTNEDMVKFISYDFSGELAATLYKRQSEAWTEGDTKWLIDTDIENQYRVTEMFSGEDGYFCTPELPFGQYLLIETTVPDGKKQADPILITIDADSSEAQPVRYIGNASILTYIRIIKEAAEGTEEYKTVLREGAAYRIKLLSDGSKWNSSVWQVDDEGYLWYYNATLTAEHGSADMPFTTQVVRDNGIIVDAYIELAQPLPFGEYQLVEVKAPGGFVLHGREQEVTDTSTSSLNSYELLDASAAMEVEFEISHATLADAVLDRYGRKILIVKQENKEQKGILEITKLGEKLFAVRNEKDMVFEYSLAPVADAVFEIYADADIYSHQIDPDRLDQYADVSGYLVHKKGDRIGTITTDVKGYGYLAGLSLGTYRIKEVVAGDGFVLNPYEETFEISPEADTRSFVVYDTTYTNERQKVTIEAVKRDADSNAPVGGAVFGLYSKEDILSYILYDADTDSYINSAAGTILVEADTLLATAETGRDGVAAFAVDLPLGSYYILELESPPGYTSGQPDTRPEVNAFYQGQDVSVQIYNEEDGMVFYNQKIPQKVTTPEREETPPMTGDQNPLHLYIVGIGTGGTGIFVMEIIKVWIKKKRDSL